MQIVVTRGAVARMVEEAANAAPFEACGILFGAGGRIDGAQPCANVAPDRARRFEIDPQALVDAYRAARGGGPSIAGYYHSHPCGPAAPSLADRRMAHGDGRVWAIVAQGAVSFWRDGEQGFEALSYAVVDG